MNTTVSILAMLQMNPLLFASLRLPAGVDKETVIDEICYQCYDQECLVASPVYLQLMIGKWSAHRLYYWTELLKTASYDYNPINNKDLKYTDTRTIDKTNKDAGYNNGTSTGTNSGENESESETSSYVTGFNSNNLVNNMKDESGDNSSYSSSSNSEQKWTFGDDRTIHETETFVHEEAGNIGITSAMSLIKEQRELVNFDIVQTIVNEFKERFILSVY